MEVCQMAIQLNASSGFETAGQQYICRITGRDHKLQFARSFVGRKSGKRNDYTEALVDDPGLYEGQSPDRKGKHRWWVLILEHKGELVKLRSDEEDAMKIAKRLDGRETIDQIVGVEVETNDDGTEKLLYLIRTPGEAKRAVVAATEGAAVEAVVATLTALPAPLQRKVLTAVRARLFPKPEPVLTTTEASAET